MLGSFSASSPRLLSSSISSISPSYSLTQVTHYPDYLKLTTHKESYTLNLGEYLSENGNADCLIFFPSESNLDDPSLRILLSSRHDPLGHYLHSPTSGDDQLSITKTTSLGQAQSSEAAQRKTSRSFHITTLLTV